MQYFHTLYAITWWQQEGSHIITYRININNAGRSVLYYQLIIYYLLKNKYHISLCSSLQLPSPTSVWTKLQMPCSTPNCRQGLFFSFFKDNETENLYFSLTTAALQLYTLLDSLTSTSSSRPAAGTGKPNAEKCEPVRQIIGGSHIAPSFLLRRWVSAPRNGRGSKLASANNRVRIQQH